MFLYIFIWLIGLFFFGFEYWSLTNQPHFSFLMFMQAKGWIATQLPISTEPGRPLSLWLGWAGLGLMVLMNLYSIRKRSQWLNGAGSLKAWLNFHVFCGLMGPTLIFFHCKMQARGLVAISFWSMIISFTSGIIGRYFYVQLLQSKGDCHKLLEKIDLRIAGKLQRAKLNVAEPEREQVYLRALRTVGVEDVDHIPNVLFALIGSIIGDLRLSFQSIPIGPQWPPSSRPLVTMYAQTRRKILYWESFQSLMGYWHTFHFPFAVFMYIAAFIHVVAALVLGV